MSESDRTYDLWCELGRDREVNPATGESLNMQGMPYRPMVAARAPHVAPRAAAIIRIDERGAES